MCSETKETGTTTRFFTPDAPNSTKVSSVYGLRANVEGFERLLRIEVYRVKFVEWE